MNAVGYVGHGTVRIEVDGAVLLTDPLLRRYVGHLRRPSPVAAGAAEGLTAILISHGHRDHLDAPSLRVIDRDVPVVVPRGLGRLVGRQGFANVTEVVEGDELGFGTVRVRATHAEHDDRRRPGRLRGDAVGYAVLGSRNVYFAGDTGPFDAMDDLVPDLHLALLPIWGWGPRVGKGHMDPLRAARAVELMGPRVAVPIHWGTLASPRAPWLDDPERPAREFAERVAAATPGVEMRVLQPGEATEVAAAVQGSEAE